MSPRTQVQLFRVVAIAEAVSWLGLLVGMYAKHVAHAGEAGVEVFGPIHGGIFLGYLLLSLLVSRTLAWGRGTTLLGLACSVPPFATLGFEVWVQRTGRLGVVRPEEPVDAILTGTPVG